MDKIVIRKEIKLGQLDAEADEDLLLSCFIDKGDLNLLLDVEEPSALIVGRTGVGKSALLLKIKSQAERSVMLDPNDISIRFLEHSDILKFLVALGVKLDLFYKLLWRHILVVELLKIRYDIKSDIDSKGMLSRLSRLVDRDKVKKQSLEYFREWGDDFWIDTDAHLQEITKRFEKNITDNVGVGFQGIGLTHGGVSALSEEQRVELRQRANRVVSGLQIKKLSELLDVLSEKVFDDNQKKYYVLLDKLDEDWAETETRCRFIRALIEEIKTFRKLRNVKILAALRQDLLTLVFDRTRDAGFQEEKYDSYILPLTWTKDELKSLIDMRINEVFRRQYTKDNISFADVFPVKQKGGGQEPLDFILERTLLRPRDVLQFMNESLVAAHGRDRVSWRALAAAESKYSNKRLKSLHEEWSEVYPAFSDVAELLRGQVCETTRSKFTSDKIQEIAVSIYQTETDGPCGRVVKKFFDEGAKTVKENDLLLEFLRVLYHVGAIGVKISSLDTYVWSFLDQPTISKGEAKRVNQIKIHKMLVRALDVRDKEQWQ